MTTTATKPKGRSNAKKREPVTFDQDATTDTMYVAPPPRKRKSVLARLVPTPERIITVIITEMVINGFRSLLEKKVERQGRSRQK